MHKSEMAPVAWYRKTDYKGSLSEEDKRELDRLRSQPNHPCASFGSLPEEVQRYFSVISFERMDAKKNFAVARTLIWTLVALAISYAFYDGGASLAQWAILLLNAVCILIAWIQCARECKKISEDIYASNEQILIEWELEYILQRKQSS